VKSLRLPPRSPNLNAFAERRVRSVKEGCLSKLILFGEASLRRALTQFQERYHTERNHQGKGDVLLFRHGEELPQSRGPSIECSERLGGLRKYYRLRAAGKFASNRSQNKINRHNQHCFS
jgi:putative transposase